VTRLILASQSPRRRDLVNLLGHTVECTVSTVEESRINGEGPDDHVIRLSLLKARDVGSRLDEGIVIGSDTVVVVNGDILEKPTDKADAVAMLLRLTGRSHTVYTGFALYNARTDTYVTGYETTVVTMRQFDRDMAERYVATDEPMDKAGAYGIQGYGAVLIEGINGCYFNVMGLPMARLMAALYEFTDGALGYFGKTVESGDPDGDHS
jgi:septum formation protein